MGCGPQLQVNNNSLVEADHHRAVGVLKEAGNNVTMVVAREVLRPSGKATTEESTSNNSVGGDSEVEIKAEVLYTKAWHRSRARLILYALMQSVLLKSYLPHGIG